MKKLAAVVLVLGLLFPVAALAVESVTQTLYVYKAGDKDSTKTYSETDAVPAADTGQMRAIKIDYVTDAAGALTAEDLAWRIDGFILKVVAIPGATAPDASYNVALTDDTGTSVIGGAMDAINGGSSYTRIPQIQVGGSFANVFGPAMVIGDVSFDVVDNTNVNANGTVWIFFMK